MEFNKEHLDKAICIDAMDGLRQIGYETIDLILTSPPYWGLRNYGEKANRIWGGDKDCQHRFIEEKTRVVELHHGECNYGGIFQGKDEWGNRNKDTSPSGFCSKCNAWKGQLGLEPTFQMYLDHLFEIFMECKRVLKRSGSMWINIGDTYSGSGSGQKDTGKHGYPPDIFEDMTIKKPTLNKQLPDKCMMGIPWRLALRLIDEGGFVIRNNVIWNKPNAMPESVRDRLTNVYEDVFFFVRDDAKSDWYLLGNKPNPEKSPKQYEKWKMVKEWWTGKKVDSIKSERIVRNGVLLTEEDSALILELEKMGADYRICKEGFKKEVELCEQPIIGGRAKHYEEKGYTIIQWGDKEVSGIKHKSEIPIDYLQYCTNLDYYFDLDAIRESYQIESLERAQRAVNLGSMAKKGKYVDLDRTLVGVPQQAPRWFREEFDKDGDYKGKFNGMESAEQFGSSRARTQRQGYKKLSDICLGCGKSISKHIVDNPKHLIEANYNINYRTGELIEGRYVKPCNIKGKNPSDVWIINTEPLSEAHFAAFPSELCKRIILVACPERGVILDPFCGSGRALAMAKHLNRRFIGFDIVPEFIQIARKMIGREPEKLDKFGVDI